MRFSVNDASKIKLIIWDLDETFWKGTLSDSSHPIEMIRENIELIHDLNKKGIVNSICSKNERDEVELVLNQYNILDAFVFTSINWEAKGERIKKTISDMGLRPANVLFIDDNPSNLGEAECLMPELMVADPSCISSLIEFKEMLGKNDENLSRLKQYQVLQKKREDEVEYATNVEFLRHSNIKIAIETNCLSEIKRIEELILRSNQLNFTKKRITEEELTSIVESPEYNTGYVSVSDKYGDYGIVGFYAVKAGILEHFLFSCRTMGMGIEQYIYSYLNYPVLDVIPPVSGVVCRENGMPDYVTLVKQLRSNSSSKNGAARILLKGTCDLEVMASYLENEEVTLEREFNFIDANGNQADYYNHTENVINSYRISEADKKELVSSFSFLSAEGFQTHIFDTKYDVICTSPMMDATLGTYSSKEGGYIIPYGLKQYPLTDSNNWERYIHKQVMTARSNFSKSELEAFSNRFEIVEYSETIVANNLRTIMERVWEKNPSTRFIILLLSETKFESTEQQYLETFGGKEEVHRRINAAIKKIVEGMENVYLIDVNQYVKKQSDYFDNINHYSKMVYYNIAKEIAEYLNTLGITGITTTSKYKAVYESFRNKVFKVFFLKFRNTSFVKCLMSLRKKIKRK